MASTATRTRRFEFVGGNSSKFWEIAVSGKDVTVRYGKIGTSGQTNMKSFPDEAAAVRHALKMVTAKIGKGYQEVG